MLSDQARVLLPRALPLAAAALIAGLLGAMPALAAERPLPTPTEDTASAKRLFQQAEARFAAGAYEAALALFRQAMAAAPHDALLFNMAVCLERLGRAPEARETYEAAARSPQLDDAARARAHAAAQRLTAPPLPAVTTTPPPEPALDLKTPAPQPPPRSAKWPGAVGWAGVGATALGATAATTLWALGQGNENAFENAIDAGDLPRARTLADRADAYDAWFKVSLGVALLGAAVTAVDLWLSQRHDPVP